MTIENLRGPWGLYAIIDPDHCSGRDPVVLTRLVLENGAGIVQLRWKTGAREEIVATGTRLKALCDEFRVPFIVNDDPRLAAEVDADGVHVGQADMAVDRARAIVGPDRLVGLSTHNRVQAIAAQNSGADYVGFGPVYSTITKETPNPELGAIEAGWAAKTLSLPVVAIGGITVERLNELITAGVENVAAISALFSAKDPGAATRAFVEGLKS